jgi:hypothetical protein
MEDLLREKLDYLDLKKSMQSSVTVEGVQVGWYQDVAGSLYHYDGVIWDVVPAAEISRLEYLG